MLGRVDSKRTHGVPLLPDDSEPVQGVAERGGWINNLYRCLANSPVLLRAWTDFAWTLRADCQTPRTLRELLILRASQLTGSEYLWDDHVRFGKEAGLDNPQIEALAAWRDSELFGTRERVALQLAEELVATGRISDRALAELESHFPPGEVVELVLTVGFYSMVPRVLDALRVPLQWEPEEDVPRFG
jgi:AhpD family alkylhydroperoxidase